MKPSEKPTTLQEYNCPVPVMIYIIYEAIDISFIYKDIHYRLTERYIASMVNAISFLYTFMELFSISITNHHQSFTLFAFEYLRIGLLVSLDVRRVIYIFMPI